MEFREGFEDRGGRTRVHHHVEVIFRYEALLITNPKGFLYPPWFCGLSIWVLVSSAASIVSSKLTLPLTKITQFFTIDPSKCRSQIVSVLIFFVFFIVFCKSYWNPHFWLVKKQGSGNRPRWAHSFSSDTIISLKFSSLQLTASFLLLNLFANPWSVFGRFKETIGSCLLVH